jgi:small subunit ribosomal protein S16
MAVKIRLSRIGKKHVPFYRIVAVDGRKKRDGACLEDLGTYDALNGTLIKFNDERIKHWISVGAIPTDTVKKLQKKYTKVGLVNSSAVKAEKVKVAAKKSAVKKVDEAAA